MYCGAYNKRKGQGDEVERGIQEALIDFVTNRIAGAAPLREEATTQEVLDLLHEASENLEVVHGGDMPAWGNLPQVDLASRSYVILAGSVENAEGQIARAMMLLAARSEAGPK